MSEKIFKDRLVGNSFAPLGKLILEEVIDDGIYQDQEVLILRKPNGKEVRDPAATQAALKSIGISSLKSGAKLSKSLLIWNANILRICSMALKRHFFLSRCWIGNRIKKWNRPSFVASLDGNAAILSNGDYQLSKNLCEGNQGSFLPPRCTENSKDRYCQVWTWKARRVCATLKRYDLTQEDLWQSAEKYQKHESDSATSVFNIPSKTKTSNKTVLISA